MVNYFDKKKKKYDPFNKDKEKYNPLDKDKGMSIDPKKAKTKRGLPTYANNPDKIDVNTPEYKAAADKQVNRVSTGVYDMLKKEGIDKNYNLQVENTDSKGKNTIVRTTKKEQKQEPSSNGNKEVDTGVQENFFTRRRNELDTIAEERGEPVDVIWGAGVGQPVYERINDLGEPERYAISNGGKEISIEEAEQKGKQALGIYGAVMSSFASMNFNKGTATAGQQKTIDKLSEGIIDGDRIRTNALIKYTNAIQNGAGGRVFPEVAKNAKASSESVKKILKLAGSAAVGLLGTSSLFQWFGIDNWLGGNSIYIRDIEELVKWGEMDKEVGQALIDGKIQENEEIEKFTLLNTMLNPALMPFKNIIRGGVKSQMETMSERAERMRNLE